MVALQMDPTSADSLLSVARFLCETPNEGYGVERIRVASAPSSLDFGVLHPREGKAPAEPRLRFDVSPGSRLSRSFALPGGPGSTPNPSVDKALGFPPYQVHYLNGYP